MKKILILTLLISFIGIDIQAQTWQQVFGRQRFNAGIGIPVRDTLSPNAADSAQMVIRPQDGILYYRYKGWWIRASAQDTSNFVTVAGAAQTISSAKTFSTTLSTAGSDTNGSTVNFNFRNSLNDIVAWGANDGTVIIGANGRTSTPLSIYGNTGLQMQVGNSIAWMPPTIRSAQGTGLNISSIGVVSGDSAEVRISGNSSNVAGGQANTILRVTGNNQNVAVGDFQNSGFILDFNQTNGTVGQNNFANGLYIRPTINNTAGTSTYRGIYYNPTLSSTTGTTNYFIEATSGKVRLGDLAGTGTRVVTADADGNISAGGTLTGYLLEADSLSGGYTTWDLTKKKVDSLGAVIATKGSGTVTSVAAGTGMNFSTITSTGTINADTTVLSTKANVTGLLTGYATTGSVATKLNISDTATMLSNYRRKTTLIENSDLRNSAITINGTSTALGGSISVGTVTSVAASAGTGISVSGSPITSNGTLTITNTAPDQTVTLTAGTGISVSGTYPNFTVTNTSPSSGGTVTSVTASAPLSSSGGTTPNITISQATTSTNGFLSSTDWNTFNNKQAQLNGTGFVRFSGTTPSYITGTSSQFLKADGSVDNNTYATTGSLSGYVDLTTNQTVGGIKTLTSQLNGTSLSMSGAISGGTGSKISGTIATGAGLFQLQDNGRSASTAQNYMSFSDNAATRMAFLGFTGDNNFTIGTDGGRNILLSGGNLGLGVTPSAWGSGFKAMQIGLGASFYGLNDARFSVMGANIYNNGTSDIYIANGVASLYVQGLGQHTWYTAPSGTAGNPITFTQAMTLTANSELLVNTTTTDGTNKLIVNGGVKGMNATFNGSGFGSNGVTATGANGGHGVQGTGGGSGGRGVFGTSNDVSGYGGYFTHTAGGTALYAGNTTIGGTIGVSGAATFSSSVTAPLFLTGSAASTGMSTSTDGSGVYQEFFGTTNATRQLRIQGGNSSGSYVQFFLDAANQAYKFDINSSRYLTITTAGISSTAGSFSSSVTATTYTGATTTVSSSTTIADGIETVFVNNTGATTITVTLPSASGKTGRTLKVIRSGGGFSSNVDVTSVNGGTHTLNCLDAIELVSDGTSWRIVAKYLSTECT